MKHSLLLPALVIGLAFSPGAPLRAAGKPTRLACVGDSITAGVGTPNAGQDSYPSQLQRMLGTGWVVGNFGDSGSTLLKNGDKPYQMQGAFRRALEFKPDVVVIMLGTNDTKPQNWSKKDQFAADYKDLIAQFRALESKPRIFVCLPANVPGKGNFGINEPALLEQIPMIEAVAMQEKAAVIDVHGATKDHDELMPDRVHPNLEGATLLARTVFQGLTGKAFAGEVPAK